MASVVFFIIGFLCGHFYQKKGRNSETLPPSEGTQAPYYDDIVLKQQNEQELELKENIAYIIMVVHDPKSGHMHES